MTNSPNSSQIAYATKLRNDIRERLTYTIDRSVVLPSFDPGPDTELMAQVRAARAEGRTDDARALRKQAEKIRDEKANAALDAYLARREQLAATNIEALDANQISAYIDEAKAAIL